MLIKFYYNKQKNIKTKMLAVFLCFITVFSTLYISPEQVTKAGTYTTPICGYDGTLIIREWEQSDITDQPITSIKFRVTGTGYGEEIFIHAFDADTNKSIFYIWSDMEDSNRSTGCSKMTRIYGNTYQAESFGHAYDEVVYELRNYLSNKDLSKTYNIADVYRLFDEFTYLPIGAWVKNAINTLGTYTEVPTLKTVNIQSDNHGTVSNVSGAYGTGTIITATASPFNGYSFSGWYNGNTLISNTNPYSFSVKGDITLTAKFIPNLYTVGFNSNGGTICSSKAVTYLTTYGTLPTTNRTGYTFVGWKDINGNIVNSNSVYNIPSDSTLTAQWITNNYSIQLLDTGVGASGATNAQPFGSIVTLNAGARDNNWFLGWKIVSGHPNLSNSAAASTTFYMPAENVILQATWNQITSISAMLNSNFYNTYVNQYNGQAYNVDSNVIVNSDMLDVYVNFQDGSKVKTTNFSLQNNHINAIGENQVKITLNGFAYNNMVTVIGYSASLSAVMQGLGLGANDYTGLASLISVMKNNIESANSSLSLYQKNLNDIKATLSSGGIDVNLGSDLVDNLQKTLVGVQNAMSKIEENERKLDTIQNAINKALELYGDNISNDGEFTTILAQIEQLKSRISDSKHTIENLTNFVNDLKQILGLDNNASPDEIYSKILLLKSELEQAEQDIETYQNAIDKINMDLGITSDVEKQNALVDKLNVITSSVNSTKDNLYNLQNQLADLVSDTNTLTDKDNQDTNVTKTDITTALSNIQEKLNVLKENTEALTTFVSTIKSSLALGAGATTTDVIKELKNIRDLINHIRTELGLPILDTGSGITEGGTDLVGNIVTLNKHMDEITKALELSDGQDIQKVLNEIETLKNTRDKLTNELDDIKKVLNISDSEADAITEILSKIDTFYRDFESIASRLGLDKNATTEEILGEIDNMRVLLNEIRVEVGLPTVASGSSIVVSGSAIVKSINDLNNNMDQILSVLQLSDKDTIKNILGSIVELQDTKKRLTDNLDSIKDTLGITESDVSAISVILDKIDSFYGGFADIAKSLGITLDGKAPVKDNVSAIIDRISQLKDDLSSATEAISDIITSLNMDNMDVNDLTTALISIKGKILDLQNKLDSTENELNIVKSQALHTVSGADIQVYSISLNNTALGNMVTEQNGIIYAMSSYEVSDAAQNNIWTDSIKPVTDDDIQFVYIRSKGNEDIVFLAARGTRNVTDENKLVKSSELVDLQFSSDQVSITTDISNEYKAILDDDLIIKVIAKDNITVLYQLVSKDSDLTNQWTVVNGNNITVTDCDNTRLYIKAVSANGSYTVQKTTGFSINTLHKYLKNIQNGKSYNTDIEIIPITDNVDSIEVNGIKTEKGTILNLQKSYEILVILKDGQKKKAKMRIDKIAPLLEGVENGKTYDKSVQIRFGDASGVTAMLNGEKFISASWVTKPDNYVLILTDGAGNSRSVKFTIK